MIKTSLSLQHSKILKEGPSFQLFSLSILSQWCSTTNWKKNTRTMKKSENWFVARYFIHAVSISVCYTRVALYAANDHNVHKRKNFFSECWNFRACLLRLLRITRTVIYYLLIAAVRNSMCCMTKNNFHVDAWKSFFVFLLPLFMLLLDIVAFFHFDYVFLSNFLISLDFVRYSYSVCRRKISQVCLSSIMWN